MLAFPGLLDAGVRPVTVLDRGVPLPPAVRRGRRAAWPWSEMSVGDSFIVPDAQIATFRVQTVRVSKKLGRKFRTARTDTGVFRCWRVE